jgi:hypothetical protein
MTYPEFLLFYWSGLWGEGGNFLRGAFGKFINISGIETEMVAEIDSHGNNRMRYWFEIFWTEISSNMKMTYNSP